MNVFKFVETIWVYGMILCLGFIIINGYLKRWTVRKLNRMTSYLIPPLLCWGGSLIVVWLPLWIGCVVEISIILAFTFLSYKTNRGGKDIAADEKRGITGTTWGLRRKQQEAWSRYTEEEKQYWLCQYQKSLPRPTPIWVLLLINILPGVTSYVILRS